MERIHLVTLVLGVLAAGLVVANAKPNPTPIRANKVRTLQRHVDVPLG